MKFLNRQRMPVTQRTSSSSGTKTKLQKTKARSVSRCFLRCFLVLLLFWGHNPSKIVTRVEKKQHLTEKKQRCFRDWDLSNL